MSLNKDGILSVRTNEGTVLIRPESKFHREFSDYMRSL